MPSAEPWTEMVDAVNAVRADGRECGEAWHPAVPALTWSDPLEAASRRHARDMARRDVLAHEGSDGSRVGERVTEAGYTWRRVAENLARADLSVEQVVIAWAESPPHCRALMDPEVVQMGAAEVERFWVLVVARPRA